MNILLIKNLAAGVLLASVSKSNPTAILASAVSTDAQGASASQPAPDALDAWLEKLASKESENRARIKILDHNNRYSYGCLQFQMETFESYVKHYNLLPEAEDQELENMIYDCSFQKTLAKKMIEEDRDNWRHWYTSVTKRGLGLPPKAETDLALK